MLGGNKSESVFLSSENEALLREKLLKDKQLVS